ncbi:hypothetical protein V8G54_037668 [Vigna mungo]|uniref:Peptidase C1A papain C-terminal domain-containing protein n=1 Tax=Vigna mungo TaxID=3915 RepID=A0AAQ3MJ02_VIGMU
MKVSGFFALLLVVGAILMFFNILLPISASWTTDFIGTKYGDKTTLIAVNRKLKGEPEFDVEREVKGKLRLKWRGRIRMWLRSETQGDILSEEGLVDVNVGFDELEDDSWEGNMEFEVEISEEYAKNAKVVSIDSYEDVNSYDELTLKKAVANKPVSVAIEGRGREFQLYSYVSF